jgi:hypothetical protein
MTKLREITLLGPDVQVGGKKETQPLWTLYAGSPYFGRKAVKPKPGTHADHAHPLRVLCMDARPVPDGDQFWRQPRLLDVHLVAGKIGDPYEDSPDDSVVMKMRFTSGSRDTPFKYLRTVAEPSTSSHAAAPFARVVTEPLISGYKPWPTPDDENIEMPPVRLVTGRVPLWVDIKHNSSKLEWLKRLGVSPDDSGWCQIWLTPDGIEFDADLPFPGLASGKKLSARVLLAEPSDRRGMEKGSVSLTLTYLGAPGEVPDDGDANAATLSQDRETNRQAWLDAWYAITPYGAGEDDRVGLKFAARRTGEVPSFRWVVTVKSGRPDGLADGIDVPGEALRIELVSPSVDGNIDGAARLRPSWVHASGNASSVEFSMEQTADQPLDHPIGISMLGTQGTELFVSATAFHSEIDVRRLAADLRAAYRVPTPRRANSGLAKASQTPAGVQAQDARTPAAGTLVERDRPLLPAFVALERGWLQLPVPNLAPLDPGNDLELATSIERSPRSVLEGFVRFRSAASSAGVLSGFNEQRVDRPECAPWSFTIERATAAILKVTLTPDPKPFAAVAPRRATLISFTAHLVGAKVSARGLLWVSSDQPDALDALPRLGAGPGSHMDIALEAVSTQPAVSPPLMAIDVTGLKLSVSKGRAPILHSAALGLRFTHEHLDWSDRLDSHQAKAALAHDREVVHGKGEASQAPWRPVLWRRHRDFPMVATMPMTRSAGASVRPLESRELIPCVMTVGQEPESLLARFTLGGADVFPGLVTDEIRLQPLPGWPLPGEVDATDSGIGFAAVGLPGVEACPVTSVGDAIDLLAAVRYDLPLLDEAFATAPLPPTPEADIPSERMTPPPRPPATAIDWPLLRDFWDAQNRMHQNARVSDSYLSTFLGVDADKPHALKVGNLIEGLTWATKIHVRTHALAQPLPYGTLTVGKKTMSANAALEDHERGFSVDVAHATLTEDGEDITVVGFSPPTFRELEHGVLLDNRRVGAGLAYITANDMLLMRPVTLGNQPAGARLVSLLQPLTTRLAGTSGKTIALAFWFKDVLIAQDGQAVLPEEGLPFQVWKDARQLAAGGLEWRLAPVEPPFAEAAFRDGRDTFSLFGYLLEPLRLTGLKITGELVSEATIECRLTLGPGQDAAKGNLLVLTLVQTEVETMGSFTTADLTLTFPFEALHDERERALVLHATLSEDAGFHLTALKLDVMIAGRWIRLSEDVSVAFERWADGETWTDRLTLTSTSTAPEGQSGQAFLYLPNLELEIRQTYEPEAQAMVRKEHPPEFVTLERAILVHPGSQGYPPRPDRAPLQILSSGVDFFGVTWSQQVGWSEGDGVLRIAGSGPMKGSGPLFGDLHGQLALGLLARVESIVLSNAGVGKHLLLAAGQLEADFRQNPCITADAKPVSLCGTQLRLVAATASFDPTQLATAAYWSGAIEVTTHVSADSCIEWPALTWSAASESIPVPGQENNGRAQISAATGGEVTRHSVEWILAGHHLPLALAADLAARQPEAVWAVPVWTRHALTRGERTLRWSAMDTIGFGASEAIVPRFTDYEGDARTFSARYAHKLDGQGNYRAARETGMDYAGRGALAKVLHGLLGSAFRRHFWPNGVKRPGWLLAGGHLGILGLDSRGDTGVLVRLPALVGLDEKVAQPVPPEGFDVAWADGPASRRVARSRPNSATPASAAYSAILAALRSLDRVDNGEVDEMVAALLVEQAMRHPHTGASSESPYFVASAIDIERLHRFAAGSKAGAVISLSSLSLIAVTLPAMSRTFAAAIMMRDGEARIPSVVRSPRVVTLGQHVAQDVWRDRVTQEAGVTKLLYGLAVARHAVPLGAMVIDDRNDEAKFVIALFPGSRMQSATTTRDFRAQFASNGRGPLAVPSGPGDKDHRRWLLPPIEGATSPVRDVLTPASPVGERHSGLAGVTTRVALASHAGHPIDTGDERADPDLIWVSQTRVPIYLPLKLTDMVGPSVGWLTPAPPRVRLPIATEVIAALAPASADESSDIRREVQPFLPPTLTTTALSERAGIRTARRFRLLGALRNGIGAFDAEIARFGRPAQAGSSFARTMRTPRPGRLPPNLGDPMRDRRVQADGLRPLTGCSAFIGAADVIEGTYAGIGRWSIVLVAAPEWESVVSDRWDGSIRLVCRVALRPETSGNADPPKTPPSARALLMKALFPELDQPPRRWGRAALAIGDARVDYSWLQVKGDPPWSVDASVLQAELSLTLDIRVDGLPRPRPAPPFPAIVDALSTLGPLPPVELQLTLRPSNPQVQEIKDTSESEITNDDPDGFPLSKSDLGAVTPGSDRTPLTLRFPLYPVTAQRGALPLTPATLLFRDRAYDRDLAGPPHEDARLATNPTNLQQGRGGLRVVLAVDRASVNRRGTLALLADVRYERPMSDRDQWMAEQTPDGVGPGGDLLALKQPDSAPSLTVAVQSRDGKNRKLRLPNASVRLAWGMIHDLSLSQLQEQDSTPARLTAGDMLMLELTAAANTKVQLWESINALRRDVTIDDKIVGRNLRVMLTDDPVVEPPSALYLALMHTRGEDGRSRLSVPLHAQSPLPFRVDLPDALRDFRKGMIGREAAFVWTLLRPARDFREKALAVVKCDRNGQLYLPELQDEFAFPERLFK